MIDLDLIWKWTMEVLPAEKFDSPAAKAGVFAIGFQESRFEHRKQMDDGPARGWWQFEQGGGVRGVLNHPYTARYASDICRRFDIEPYPWACWAALEWNDVLACAFARLLLYTAPWPLPGPEAHAEAWRQYLWAWRPGKPHEDTWKASYVSGWQMV